MALEAELRVGPHLAVVLAAEPVRADQQAAIAAVGIPPRAGQLVGRGRRANGEIATHSVRRGFRLDIYSVYFFFWFYIFGGIQEKERENRRDRLRMVGNVNLLTLGQL